MRKEMPPQYPEEPTMNKQTNSKEQTQNANVWVKMAVLLVIIISTAALLITYVSISKLRDTNRKLEQQAIELEEDNKDLQTMWITKTPMKASRMWPPASWAWSIRIL